MPEKDINSPASILGAIGVVVMVPMFFLVMPIYVGALIDDYGFTNAQVGYLISAELGSAALASLTALIWLRKVNWQRSLLTMLVVLGIANLVSIYAGGDYQTLFALRPIAGFSAGAMMSIALAALGDTREQDRNFAFAVVGQLGVSGGLLLILPLWVSRWGAASVFTLFIIASVVALPLARLVPASGKKPTAMRLSERGSLLPLWGLAGTVAVFIGQSAVWAFIERMGSAAGLAPTTIGIALGTSVIAGIAGALLASWLVDRSGRLVPMVISMIGEATCLLLLLGTFTAIVFFVAVFLYAFFWNFWLPYQMGVVAETDISGRFIALITFTQAVGIAAGPALVGPLLTENNFDPAVQAGIGFAVLAFILFLPIIVARKALPAEVAPTID